LKGDSDMSVKQAAILMGSESDLKTMRKAAEVFQGMGVTYEMKILSAHRLPQHTAEYARSAKARKIEVIICGAGMAAHLAGAVAAQTTLPVIGVPLAAGALTGVDALYATVQMPTGIPVATVAIDGAANAAHLACQILGLKDDQLAQRLEAAREASRQKILAASEKLSSQ
jgi:5-(carboxyamino)imidazole ribonucleotide mutase